MFCNLNLTDMETCYKVFRTDLLKSIPIRSDRFGFEPEITMKCAKRKLRIYEVPISYHGRTYEEGKKIGWRDGAEGAGRDLQILADRRPLRDAVRPRRAQQPHRHPAIPELAGAHAASVPGRHGARTRRGHRQYRRPADGPAAACTSRARRTPLHLHALRNRFLRTPNVQVRRIDPADPADFADLEDPFDTVLAINVLEYLDDPAATVRSLARSLKPGGRLVTLVPQGPGLYGTLDKAMGHRRRFSSRRYAAVARSERVHGGTGGELQQDRRAAVVALQPRLPQRPYQQGDAEDLR